MKLVKLVKLNNLQYNPNRDPEFYRVVPNREFRLQVLLGGEGEAHCRFEADEDKGCTESIALPGTFECRFSYATPGIRLGRLTITGPNETYSQDLRLDVMEHEWIG